MPIKPLTSKMIKGLLLVQAIFFLLAGCNRNEISPEPIKTEETSTPVYVTVTNTILSPTPSTAPPVWTQTPTILVPSLTSTVTSMPTLTYERSKEYILELIKNNEDSKLPCFWGICPEITDWDTTIQFIRYLNARSSIDEREDGNHLSVWFDFIPVNLPVHVEFIEKGGVIENISVGMRKLDTLEWEPYKLSTVLSTYGPPSKVLLGILFPVEPPLDYAVYDLFLFYDEHGIYIYYPGTQIENESILYICPNSTTFGKDNVFVMELGNMNSDYSSDSITQMTYMAQDLERSTNMTIDAFYQAFKDESSSECILTDNLNWPMAR